MIRSDRDAPAGSEIIECDVSDARSVAALLETAGPVDGIFHLAAITFVPQAMANPERVMDVNYSGTKHVVEHFMKASPGARIVFVSTSEVYGPPVSLPVDESHQINPQNPYAESKAAADRFCEETAESRGIDIVRVRPFNHSGAGQADSFVLSSFARQIAAAEAGLQPRMIRVGNLEAARDFSHVDDVVRAHVSAFENGEPGAVYNVCSGESVRIQDALDLLLDQSSVQIDVEVDPNRYRPLDVPEVRGDHGLIAKTTGWAPERSFGNILDDLLAYWRVEVMREASA